ncbi:MAG: RnfABCDGE type electron transport complex subunit D [Chromatiaceae bacterium]|nr:MAG: RnfABCDGE type electron transport complex subunit D [Chromatiaceae bacterium]
MTEPSLIASPHAHAPRSVGSLMGLVLLALLPATLFGLYLFGWPALFLFAVTIAAALGFEALALLLAGRPVRDTLLDGSALLTGWLLALTLPPWAPWWIGVLGGFLAVVLGKQVFGGIGQNLFNPAMVARVALLISFPLEMTRFVTPAPLFSAGAPDLPQALAITFGGGDPTATWDAFSGASLLGQVRTGLSSGLSTGDGPALADLLAGAYDPLAALLGLVPGSLGETSALLLLAGGLLLIARRAIDWAIPLAVLGSLALLATGMHLLAPDQHPGPLYHLLSGSAMLCAFFIATDPVTSPVSRAGQALFGVGVGVLIYVIRTWGGYPEGVAFAVLLMNACTPMIDHYLRPRVYGRDRRGQPLEYPAADRPSEPGR